MNCCKAKDYVEKVKHQINAAETALTEAHAKAEKSENKTIIENAMNSLQNACNCLCEYKD